MIYSKLTAALQNYPDKPFIISPSGQWSYADIHRYAQGIANKLGRVNPSRIAVYMPDSPGLIALVFGAAMHGRSLALISRELPTGQVRATLKKLRVQLVISDSDEELGCEQLPAGELAGLAGAAELAPQAGKFAEAELILLTSGTTGAPKCVRYLWSDLLAQVAKQTPSDDERWLLAYRLNHFAGVQMLCHVLVNHSTLVLTESNGVADAVAAMLEYRVTHVSSTPTFWRFALAFLVDVRGRLQLRHITLGSEAVSEDLLQRLRELFPCARIVHIYALTEAGSCISVSDGKPGLPIAVLQRPTSAPVQFRVKAGELQVKTRHGMTGYLDQPDHQARDAQAWLATGDLVKIEGERILFIGRRSETINVGGVKVHPLEVEGALSSLPGVKLVRVYGRDSPVVGQIVALDLVVDEGWEPQTVEAAVREACLSLPRHSRPLSINLFNTLDTNNFKLARREAELL